MAGSMGRNVWEPCTRYIPRSFKVILRVMAYNLPGVSDYLSLGTGGSGTSARYYYSVWLRHLVMAFKNGIPEFPEVIAELGPGDSLGVGLAALLSGARRYYAIDVLPHVDIEKNKQFFEELIALFQNIEPIPGETEFSKVYPGLDCYDFPSQILSRNRLAESLDAARLASIREELSHLNDDSNTYLSYITPEQGKALINRDFLDLILSQAVLEHVEDLEENYRHMSAWLKPGGLMSHTIDFSCHGSANEWNGHWGYSDFLWKLMQGRRKYWLNRCPYSSHMQAIQKYNFSINYEKKYTSSISIKREQLASRFKNISEDDFNTRGVFFQCRKLL
jgi:hypothetical protein